MEVLLKRSAKLLVASFPFVRQCTTTFFWCKITSSLSLTSPLQKSSFCQWLCCIQLFPLLPPCPYNSWYIAIWKAMLSKLLNFTLFINSSTPQIGQLPISSIYFWRNFAFQSILWRKEARSLLSNDKITVHIPVSSNKWAEIRSSIFVMGRGKNYPTNNWDESGAVLLWYVRL